MASLRRALVAAIAVSGAYALAACGGGGTAATTSATVAAACLSGTGSNAHATTNSYVVQVDLGSVETMYTPAQVTSQHPTSGEVMLRGQMAGMAGQHLEVHICSKATGAVVQDANPTITLTNDADQSMTQNVPIAVMQGVTSGVSDLHYGNNVALMPGATYTVAVSLVGETATLRIPAPTAPTATTTAGGPPSTMAGMPGMP
jgi:hypothetical protein